MPNRSNKSNGSNSATLRVLFGLCAIALIAIVFSSCAATGAALVPPDRVDYTKPNAPTQIPVATSDAKNPGDKYVAMNASDAPKNDPTVKTLAPNPPASATPAPGGPLPPPVTQTTGTIAAILNAVGGLIPIPGSSELAQALGALIVAGGAAYTASQTVRNGVNNATSAALSGTGAVINHVANIVPVTATHVANTVKSIAGAGSDLTTTTVTTAAASAPTTSAASGAPATNATPAAPVATTPTTSAPASA